MKDRFVGVRRRSDGWKAEITLHGKKMDLGTYDSPEEAARAYDREKIRVRGKDVKGLNFPEEHVEERVVGSESVETLTSKHAKREKKDEEERMEGKARREVGWKGSTSAFFGWIFNVASRFARVVLTSLLVLGLLLGILLPFRQSSTFDRMMSTSQEVLGMEMYTRTMRESWIFQEFPAKVERAFDSLPLERVYIGAHHISAMLNALRIFTFERSKGSCAYEVNQQYIRDSLGSNGELWSEVADRLIDDLQTEERLDGAAGEQKALVVLFLTPSKASVEGTREIIEKAFSRCAETDCLLKINLKDYGDPNASLQQIKEWKGSLQLRLANFLRRCPRGVLLVENVLMIHPLVVPALSNGMGEGGAYVHDGKSVSATGATFVLTSGLLPLQISGRTEEELTTTVKGSIVSALSKSKGDLLNLQDDRAVYANAFRRRIDYIVPAAVPPMEGPQ